MGLASPLLAFRCLTRSPFLPLGPFILSSSSTLLPPASLPVFFLGTIPPPPPRHLWVNFFDFLLLLVNTNVFFFPSFGNTTFGGISSPKAVSFPKNLSDVLFLKLFPFRLQEKCLRPPVIQNGQGCHLLYHSSFTLPTCSTRATSFDRFIVFLKTQDSSSFSSLTTPFSLYHPSFPNRAVPRPSPNRACE